MLCAALAACQPKKAISMTPEESARIAPITAKLATRCVGRYLIDVPTIFEISPVQHTQVEKVQINIVPTTKAAFELLLKGRRAELEAERNVYDRSAPTLKEVVRLEDGAGLAFNRADSTSTNLLRVWELRAYRDGFSIDMRRPHRDGSYSNDQTNPGPTDTKERLEHLIKLYSRTRPRLDSEIPIEQGLCVANGFIAGPPTDEEEAITSFVVKGAEDGQTSFEYFSTIGPEKSTLLGRRAGMEEALAARKGRLVRAGKRETNHGLSLEEWLEFKPHENTGKDMYWFIAEMNSLTGSARAPMFRMDFGSGNGIPRLPESLDATASRPTIEKPIFSEAESLAIWDAMLPTLRMRPGAL